MASCPECDAQIDVDDFDVDLGDTLSCQECGQILEVTNLSPIELDTAPDDDEEDKEDTNEGGSSDADPDEEDDWES